MARPTLYTEERVNEIIVSLSAGCTDKDAALASGISESTFAKWQTRYSGFSDRVTRAKAQRARGWLLLLRQNAVAGDTKAITELLDRCAPDYRKTNDVNVKHSGTIGTRDLSVFTDAEVEAMAAIGARVKGGADDGR